MIIEWRARSSSCSWSLSLSSRVPRDAGTLAACLKNSGRWLAVAGSPAGCDCCKKTALHDVSQHFIDNSTARITTTIRANTLYSRSHLQQDPGCHPFLVRAACIVLHAGHGVGDAVDLFRFDRVLVCSSDIFAAVHARLQPCLDVRRLFQLKYFRSLACISV